MTGQSLGVWIMIDGRECVCMCVVCGGWMGGVRCGRVCCECTVYTSMGGLVNV